MKNKLLLIAMGFALTTQMISAQVPSYAPTNGLVGYWSFNDNANDSSTNANNGIVNGATLTTDRFGNANSAYRFNGNDSRIDVTDNNSQLIYGAQQPATISMWVLKSDNSSGDLISKGWHSNNPSLGNKYVSYGFNPAPDSNSFIFNLYDFSTINGVRAPLNYFNTSTWYHLVIVRNSNIKFYVNGVDLTTNAMNEGWTVDYNSILNNTPFTIGARNFKDDSGNPSFSNYFNGKIDDIGIWNRALTEDEINNLYNANICYQNITVTDTLIINTGILSYNPVTYNNTVTIYPNPANDQITINCGNLANVTGCSIKIFNELGQEVFSGTMNTQQYSVPLNSWTGNGLYLVKIYDASNNVINTKKIILQ